MMLAGSIAAVVDLETSGLDPLIHEILDLAVLVVDQATLKVQGRYSARVRPTNIRRAAKRALAVVGYSEREWRNAEMPQRSQKRFFEVRVPNW